MTSRICALLISLTAMVPVAHGSLRVCETAWSLAGAAVGAWVGEPKAGAQAGAYAGRAFAPACVGNQYRHAALDLNEAIPIVEICLDNIVVSRIPPSDVCSSAPGQFGGKDPSPWRDGYQVLLADMLNSAGSVLIRNGARVAGKNAFECVASLSPRYVGADDCVVGGKRLPVSEVLKNLRSDMAAHRTKLERAYRMVLKHRKNEVVQTANAAGGTLGLGAVVGSIFLWLRRHRRQAVDLEKNEYLDLSR